MSTGFVDIHQHLLWGMDDGARTPQMMDDMLTCAQTQHIARIYATPHAMPGFRPFDAGLYAERLALAQEAAARHGIQVLPGAEVAWTYHTLDALRQGRIPTLNNTDHVLLELWASVDWRTVEDAVRQLLCAGFVPILAHVERYRCFTLEPKRAEALKQQYPVLYQVNAASLLGKDGLLHRHGARMLVRRHLADAIATDAHNCSRRPIDLLDAHRWVEATCGADEAYRLTHADEVFE